jgi:hypothetical protein
MKSFSQYLSEKRNTASTVLTVPGWIKQQKEYTSDIRTQIYESTVCIVAIKGKNPNIGDIKSVMKNAEFNSHAKAFYDKFFTEHSGQSEAYTALRDWVRDVGGKAADLGSMDSFIHKSIDNYYKAAPETFEVPAATKNNTADAILIETGSPRNLFAALDSLRNISKTDQVKRTKTDGWKNSRITITDGKGKSLVSFYQCSLKNDGQVGKSGAYLNKNYIGGTEITKSGTEKIKSIASPSAAYSSYQKLNQSLGEEYLYDKMLDEGKLIDFAKGKLSKVISSVSNFVSWAANQLSKIVKRVVGRGQAIANKLLRKNKGLKAIENIFGQIGQPLSEEFFSEAKEGPVKLTPGMVNDFNLVYNTFLKSSLINDVHSQNIKLLNDLNSHKDPDRKQNPVVMLPNEAEAAVSTSKWAEKIKPLTGITYDKNTKTYNPGKLYKWPKDYEGHITREDLDPMFKIAMNFSANVAVYGILKGMKDEIENANIVTSAALFTLSGQLEGEVRFGNTALPLVIIYGGKHQEIKAMGKRDKFVKDLTKGLKPGLKGDYPILVFRYNKQGDKAPRYNTVNMRLLSKIDKSGDGLVPEWLEFGIRTNTGSSFSCTIEASNPTKSWSGKS